METLVVNRSLLVFVFLLVASGGCGEAETYTPACNPCGETCCPDGQICVGGRCRRDALEDGRVLFRDVGGMHDLDLQPVDLSVRADIAASDMSPVSKPDLKTRRSQRSRGHRRERYEPGAQTRLATCGSMPGQCRS
jgi:hypothetical protein